MGPGRRLLENLHSDPDAKFDAVVELDAAQIVPQVTWGTSPEMVLGVDARVPDPDKEKDAVKRGAIERALTYMGLEPGKAAGRHPRRQGVHRIVHQQPH
jgi:3-isopropylmalate/(R)-2-methylmalate dehydratase large subunit